MFSIDPMPPLIRHLARRLVALEKARVGATADGCEATRVCDKLRVPLVKLAGVAGFLSLLSRALALAKSAEPILKGVQVQPDGTLSGFAAIAPERRAEAGEVVVAQLLHLLVTFIGKPLTLRLVGEAWPEATIGLDEGSGEAS